MKPRVQNSNVSGSPYQTAHSSPPLSASPSPSPSPSPSALPSSSASIPASSQPQPQTQSHSSPSSPAPPASPRSPAPSSTNDTNELVRRIDFKLPQPLSCFEEFIYWQGEPLVEGKFDLFETAYKLLAQQRPAADLYRPDRKESEEIFRSKNRWQDVLPYGNHTRVQLACDGDDTCSNYVNASWVHPLLRGARFRYISASAPPPAAFADFWKMIWQQDARLIVMLTRLVENKRTKADLYWPEGEINDCVRHGEFLVSVAAAPRVIENGTLIIRTFHLQKQASFPSSSFPSASPSTEVREIVHLQYVAWPDFKTPQGHSSMITLFQEYRQYRQKLDPERDPVLVHCSAGIGRSGTFISLDQLLDDLNTEQLRAQGIRDPPISIWNLVVDLRRCRHGMVQTADQYQYIHMFLLHCLTHNLLGVSFQVD